MRWRLTRLDAEGVDPVWYRTLPRFLFLLLPLLVACGSQDPRTTLVARAAGHELTVEQQARLLLAASGVENRSWAALDLTNLWVDYLLLGTAAAEDSSFQQLEIGPLIEHAAERAMLAALHDSIAAADVSLTPDQVRQLYDQEGRDSEIRARQILIAVPPYAPPARHDSARAALLALRQRIVEGGESFEALAREHSEDPRSAPRDGDLGFFGRGDMVEPFQTVAYGLRRGEVSDVVQTPFGYHLIRLEDRRTPTRETFRERVLRNRGEQAAEAYLARLERRAAPQLQPGAVGVVRQLARQPGARRGGADGPLVRYAGGTLGVQDVRDHLDGLHPQLRSQIPAASDEWIFEGVLRPLVRHNLLVAEARRQGLEWGAREKEEAAADVRRQVQEVARRLGLPPATGDVDAPRPEAIRAAVEALLQEVVATERELIRLGTITPVLRAHYQAEVREDRIDLVLERVAQLAEERPASDS